jgi:hypothetical protein
MGRRGSCGRSKRSGGKRREERTGRGNGLANGRKQEKKKETEDDLVEVS